MSFDKTYAERMLEGLCEANLVSLRRAGDMIRFQFAYGTNANPFMHIHVQSSYRVTMGCKIILASADIYQPNSVHLANQDFVFSDFDWTIFGENRFDETVQSKILPILDDDFVVKDIELSNFGDLKIIFKNGYHLEVYLDTSGEEECWRFLNTQDADIYLIVTGVGIEK